MTYSIASGCTCGNGYTASEGTCVSNTDLTTMGTYGTITNNYDVINLNEFVV